MKDDLVKGIAILMHDTYEEQAKIVGWKTQESCRVPFDDLPESNKKVMLAVAKAVLDSLVVDRMKVEDKLWDYTIYTGHNGIQVDRGEVSFAISDADVITIKEGEK